MLGHLFLFFFVVVKDRYSSFRTLIVINRTKCTELNLIHCLKSLETSVPLHYKTNRSGFSGR